MAALMTETERTRGRLTTAWLRFENKRTHMGGGMGHIGGGMGHMGGTHFAGGPMGGGHFSGGRMGGSHIASAGGWGGSRWHGGSAWHGNNWHGQNWHPRCWAALLELSA